MTFTVGIKQPLFQDSVEARVQRRKEQAEETAHMEKEMQEALAAMKDREAQEEASRKAGLRVIRIATPGAPREPGTPRQTPRRFGI